MAPLNVFVSATSRDLRSYRQVVTDWARSRGYDPVVQDEFPVQSDYATIVQMLRDKLAPCDAVIHLAGTFYGFEPTNIPAGERRRSYTQLEYDLGRELQRQVFRFIARAGDPPSGYTPDQPIDQTDEQRDLQRQHRERLTRGSEPYSATSRTTGNELYYEFSTPDELRKLLELIEIRPHVAKPVNLPFRSLGSLFKGREEFIQKLRRVLVEKPTHVAAVVGKQAIHGLGGVGKTRTAIEYGWRYEHEYTALLFLSADSPASLQRNLADLCGAMVLDLPEQTAQELSAQVAAAIQWLREHAGWFLILDNVDTDEALQAVEQLLTKLSSGHVVITSRLAQWDQGVESLDLDVLTPESGAEFLLERTAGKRRSADSDETDALLLSKDLDGLALALEQAGAFIAKHCIRLADYRQRWQQQDARVLEWFDPARMKYPRSVATTWQTSIDQLGDDGRQLLDVLCWLAPDPIPREMIEKLAEIEDPPAINTEQGLGELTTYSLARWESAGETVQIHRLVEEITRYRLPEAERKGRLITAMKIVMSYFPFEAEDVRFWSICQLAAPHARAVTVRAATYGDPEPASSILNQLAAYNWGRAEHATAEPLMRRVLAIDKQSYGELHPRVAKALNNLAQLLQATNRWVEAEPLMRRALMIDEHAYGKHHPEVARDLNNMAGLFKVTNRSREAEPLLRRAIAIDEQSYGEHHPKVAVHLNNLSLLLQATNRLAESEPMMRRALAIDKKSFGEFHPYVARDLNNLATLLQATNRAEEAEPLLRQALAINEKSYGVDHPTVAMTLNNLSQLLHATDRIEDAEPLLRRALDIDEKLYGKHHPNISIRLNNLALVLQATNRMAEAESHLWRALEIDEQSYGKHHPNVATKLSNLASLLQSTNRLSEAEPLIRRAITIDEMSLGPDHPDVARDLNNLAVSLLAMNRISEVEPLMRRVIQILRRFNESTGHRHPHLMTAINNYRGLLEAMQVPEAERVQRLLAAGVDPEWFSEA